MTNSKHTSGTWKVIESYKSSEYPFIAVVSNNIGDTPDLNIALCNYGGDNYAKETIESFRQQALANARLIAAAPDLLSAAKTLLQSSLNSDGSRSKTVKSTALALLEQAIAKAEGK